MGTKQRVIILDYNHLAHRYLKGARPLSIQVYANGTYQTLDTTIPAYSLKFIARLTDFGRNPTLICFDRPIKGRYEYFKTLTQKGKEAGTEEVIEYKAGRSSGSSALYTGIKWTETLLREGGVRVAAEPNYEADDLIFAAVQYAKRTYPDLPIDIITGDGDLIPLVDEQVNVYMRGKYTIHVPGSPEHNKYIQVSKANFEEAIGYITAFKNYNVPYNATLLVKLLRGDSADNLKPIAKFTPTKMRKLFDDLREADVDFDKLCRYGKNQQIYVDPEDANNRDKWCTEPTQGRVLAHLDAPELKHMINVLKPYLDNEVLREMAARYRGMNLNNSFQGLPQGNRLPYPEIAFGTYNIAHLQVAANRLKINLPLG